MKNILVIEDDHLLNNTLSYNLCADGYHVDSARSASEATKYIAEKEYELIILDVNLPDGRKLKDPRATYHILSSSRIKFLCKFVRKSASPTYTIPTNA